MFNGNLIGKFCFELWNWKYIDRVELSFVCNIEKLQKYAPLKKNWWQNIKSLLTQDCNVPQPCPQTEYFHNGTLHFPLLQGSRNFSLKKKSGVNSAILITGMIYWIKRCTCDMTDWSLTDAQKAGVHQSISPRSEPDYFMLNQLRPGATACLTIKLTVITNLRHQFCQIATTAEVQQLTNLWVGNHLNLNDAEQF